MKRMKMGYAVQTGMNVSACCACIEALGLCTFEEELDDPAHEHKVPDVLSHEGELLNLKEIRMLWVYYEDWGSHRCTFGNVCTEHEGGEESHVGCGLQGVLRRVIVKLSWFVP